MMRALRSSLRVTLLALAAVPWPALAKLPTDLCAAFPAPPKATLESVAQQMDFNGVPMMIRHFVIESAPAEVLVFYRNAWAASQGQRGPVEYPLGPWQVIATLRNPCFYTVQVKPYGRNGAEGFLGLSAPPPERPQVKEEVPRLPGSEVVNDMGHNDAGKTARTVLIQNGFSPRTNADFYRQNLEGQGWKVAQHIRADRRNTKGEVLVLRDGVRELSITVTPRGDGSNVLLNYVDQP
ncbi:MAG: hypothetical protein JSR19_12705 [Proteobacteria bacterium]|nr:hypothetical protein [Pseudomonadota bacterium]HQR04063.1 hypothetical protein [Rhodocyclaceae bacterium]